jgi:acyl carrier protein
MPEQPDADLASKVIAVIAKAQRIPAETIKLDSTFEELKIDSLDGINIVFALENEFGIDVPDEGAQNLRSVRETVDGIAKLIEEKAATKQKAAADPAPVDRDKTA